MPYDILSSQQFQDDYKFSVQFVDDIENGLQATMEHISKLLTNVGLFVLFLTSMTFVDRWIPLYVIALTVMDFSFLVAAQSFEGKHLPELKRLDNQLKTVELRARQAGQAKDIRMFHAAAFSERCIREREMRSPCSSRKYSGNIELGVSYAPFWASFGMPDAMLT